MRLKVGIMLKDEDPDVAFMKWNGYPRGGEKGALGRAFDKSQKSWIARKGQE
jgi:hypothetical protein